MLLANFAIAQSDDQHDSVVLRGYYSDLYLAFSNYEIDDVPFQQKRVKVRRNDSLLTLAKRNNITKLDSFHLAAALYEANAQMFGSGDPAQFSVGATIKMPSVGDIFYAQKRYENLKVVGENLDFTNKENQMRNGLREPFSKSHSILGPLAADELPRNQVVALAMQPNTSQERGMAGGELAAKLDSNQNKNARVSDVNIATDAAVDGSEPAIGASRGSTGELDGNYYLGPPRNSSASSSNISSDPLSSIVEWKFDSSASLGTALNKLAEYVGYELTTTDDTVLDTYTRQLPALQRSIKGITAENGFSMLAGRGLETVFDHVARSVKHTARSKTPSKQKVDIVEGSPTHEELVQASGISSMLAQLPADILSAAGRHASRCDSSVSTQQLDAAHLYKVVISRLQQKTPEPVARNLVDWYKSPTGREVLKLEKQQIDDAVFQQFSIDVGRSDRIKQIYNNTVTGRGIASIAIELDYAGWLLSGCRQKAESSGDVRKMNQEMVHGQGIKKKVAKLESILREEMLHSLAYQFSSLSEGELTEYAEVITEHAGVYSELEQSIVDAIELETKVNTVSALD